MRTHFLRTDWRYWAGTVDDLLKPAQTALDYVHARSDHEVPFEATVTLPGQQVDAESLAELRESIRDHDIPGIETITMKIGNPTLRVDLDVRRGWLAVALRTRGTDQVAVNGLHSTIAAELDRGRRISYGLLLMLRVATGVLIGVALPVAILVSGAITSIPTGEISYDLFGGAYEASDFRAEPWVIPALVALPIIGFAVAAWGHLFAIHDLELLRPGEATRYARVRGLVWAAALTLIVGPIAGIAWAAFFRQ